MTDSIQARYDAFYRARDPSHVYPVEFVVRAFLGNYPRLQNDPGGYVGQRVLDLGFGDGRNMPLLVNLGMEVHGVEISTDGRVIGPRQTTVKASRLKNAGRR